MYQALELEFKTELLKKAQPLSRSGIIDKAIFTKKVAVRKLLQWSFMAASSYYYQPSKGKRGMRPSTHTLKENGKLFENSVVVESIEAVLRGEFCCYGYHNMTAELSEEGRIINHKKVYRLMKESRLLADRR
jgi:hypothetical protein